MGHGTFNSNKIYFLFIPYLTEKKIAKRHQKVKIARQSSKTGISDFELEYAKMFPMKFCYYGSNFRQKFQAILEYVFRESTKYTRPSPSHSKDERLKDIGHSMSIGNLILNVCSATVSHLIHYDSLLQNVTDLLQNATAILL